MTHTSRKDRQATRKAEKRNRARKAGAVVGVDAGKLKHALVVRTANGVDSRPLTFDVSHDGFRQAEDFILQKAGGIGPQEILVGVEFAGVYGQTLANYLHGRGFDVVSVSPAHTKAYKQVTHGRRVKTDEKDAVNITGLVADGHFQNFPFLKSAYAELRQLVSARERVSQQRSATLTRLRSTLQVTWPEYEKVFKDLRKKTAMLILRTFPGPQELLAAPKARVVGLLNKASGGHLGEEVYEQLRDAAKRTIALPGGMAAHKAETLMLLRQVSFYNKEIRGIESTMQATMAALPEAQALMSIPGVAPVAAAIFLGSIGDPLAYESSRQVLAMAGLSLTENSSGARQGAIRISKEGRPLVRRLAFMLGLVAIRKKGIYHAEFDALVKRNGGKKIPAVVAIGRKLLRLMFSVARSKRAFTPEPPGKQPKIAA